MKNFNYAYKNLKDQANELKATHFKQSGNIELGERVDTDLAARLVEALYKRYSIDWQNFKEDLISDAEYRGYNVDKVLQIFPQPILPEETINVGLIGNWESYDG